MARRVCALALLCLLAMPAVAGASLLPDPDAGQADAVNRRLATVLLEHLDREGWEKRKQVRVGDWYLYPDGFAFRLPEGFENIGAYRGINVMLVDTLHPDTLQRTTIAVSIGPEDRNLLKTLTPERASSAFASSFQRFELLGADSKTPFGTGGVRLTYVTGTSPQVLTHQYLFNKEGHLYTLTLTVENNIHTVRDGLEKFAALCDSFLLCGDTGASVTPREPAGVYAFAP